MSFSPPGHAVTITSVFNPIPWLSLNPLTSPEFTYTITITTAEIATANASLPAGAGGVKSLSLKLPAGSGLSGSGSGTGGVNYTYAAGPPPTLTLTSTSGTGFAGGEVVTITSADDPSSVIGPHVPVTPTGVDGSTGSTFVSDAGSLIIPGVSTPVYASLPGSGGTDVTGTATPGTFVYVWQDNNLGAHGSNFLGDALVDGSGSFDVALSRDLTSDLVSIGVTPTEDFVPGGGQVVFQFIPVPEPSTLALLGTGVMSLSAMRRRLGKFW